LEEQSRRKKNTVELNTNIDDDIPSTQQENMSQKRRSKEKKNMSQPLLVFDPLVRVKTKGRPKAAIRVKHGLEVSLDLKNKKTCGYCRKKVITGLHVQIKRCVYAPYSTLHLLGFNSHFIVLLFRSMMQKKE
jgi:hypothetical protein